MLICRNAEEVHGKVKVGTTAFSRLPNVKRMRHGCIFESPHSCDSFSTLYVFSHRG